MPTTISDCLTTVGISDPASLLSPLPTLDDQFRTIKRSYFRTVLTCHPDKGGTAEQFRAVQASFETLRSIYESRSVDTFADPTSIGTTVDGYDETREEFSSRRTPSWEYYETAAAEDVPIYRVEIAKSGRSRCKQKSKIGRKCEPETVSSTNDKGGEVEREIGALIGEGEARIGWLDEQSGGYGNWVHLECWRVPSKVWLGLPDPETCSDASQFEAALVGMNQVLLCGVDELPTAERDEFVRHVMDRTNWAKLVKRKAKQIADGSGSSSSATSGVAVPGAASSSAAAASAASSSTSSSAIVSAAKGQFVIPIPGVGKAKKDALAGKTCVLTGVFPEVGGGSGLTEGKQKMKKLIESFGGRVTGSVSGKTDFVIVGKEPGMSKVSNARDRPNCTLLSLFDLKSLIEGGAVEDVPTLVVSTFSAGYSGRNGSNSLALKASAEELQIAAGTMAPQIANEAAKPPAKASKKSGKKKKAADVAADSKKGGKKRSAATSVDEDGDGDKKPAAKKKTKKAQADEARAAKKAQADSDKAARRAKAAADKAVVDEANRKRDERHSAAIEDYDWRSDLESGELDGETVTFIKDVLRHLGLALKGKKAVLLKRLRAYAATHSPGSEGSDDEEVEDENGMDVEEKGEAGENDMDLANAVEEVTA